MSTLAPDELRVPTVSELQRAVSMTAHLCDYSLATGARRSVSQSTSLFGPATPTVYIDQIAGYHLVPVHLSRQSGGTSHRLVGWRVDRVVTYPGLISEESDDAPGVCYEPLQVCETIESAVAQVILDVHRYWLTDEIDAYLNDEYLHGFRTRVRAAAI